MYQCHSQQLERFYSHYSVLRPTYHILSFQGDSGGPLVCQERGAWTLVGIVSWGLETCDVNIPAMYTSVPFLRRWIEETIASN